MTKKKAWEWIDEYSDEFIEVSDKIWEYAEYGLCEDKSSELVAEKLREHGFKVKHGVAGMPTAIYAEWGKGKPVIATQGEYDALPGISNKVVPWKEPLVEGGNTLILGHKNLVCKKITDKNLLDDTIYEVTWEGEIVWEWVCSDHFDEFEFREDARNILSRDPNMRPTGGGMGDWMHMNSMSALGPNKWYDAGDERFHPDNIIADGRETNILFIISKETGKIVWRVGPDYDCTPEKDLGWIIGQHHAHMIPRGLPGEGNILVYDNGGWAGYGSPNPGSPTGAKNALRDYSRVLEFDPVTLKIVWQHTPQEAGFVHPTDSNRFYSPFISSAQRLPNGNTLIAEGSGGRIFEITAGHKLVWEYISPYWGTHFPMNMVYRAYRVPYEWIPQIDPPTETEIRPLDVTTFRVPGASPSGPRSESSVEGTVPYQSSAALCVVLSKTTPVGVRARSPSRSPITVSPTSAFSSTTWPLADGRTWPWGSRMAATLPW